MLFVNAGITNNPQETIGRDGTVGVMSSGQGSVSNNTSGKRELYRASKTALNAHAQFPGTPGHRPASHGS